MSIISQNLKAIRKQISPPVRLLAVSKGHSNEAIQEAVDAEQVDFGESYAQELLMHHEGLPLLTKEGVGGRSIHWHFIGHLQTNKVKQIIDKVEFIHSVDSEKLAAEINKQAFKINKIQKILIEVKLGQDVSGEEQKTGISEDKLFSLITTCKLLNNIQIVGLMTIPPYNEDIEKTRPYFKKLKQIFDRVNEEIDLKIKLTELSMGMSHDFRVAIEEGATIVRLGTAIFGGRKL